MKPSDIPLALIVVVIWGLNFIVINIGLQDLPPILFTALRFLVAALPLAFFIKPPAVPLRLLAGYALFQFASQFTLLFYGLHFGFPPGLASLVMQLQVFFTIGFAVLLLGERPRVTQLLGALVAFCGMGLVAAHLEAKATLIGFVLVICASLSWGIANIFTKKIGKVNPLALVVWGSVLATPPLLLTSLLFEGWPAWTLAAQHLQLRSVGAVLYQAFPNTIIGYGIWSHLMRKYPTATIAPFSLLVPVIGILSAAWIVNEPLQWWKITAGVLVLCGLALNLFGGFLSRRAAVQA
ncbi:MAG: EamA family transporter [Herminiimonas sp.]|nr:EamA family transporter [Herminiimonas sp.]